jgi:hypothetical protein
MRKVWKTEERKPRSRDYAEALLRWEQLTRSEPVFGRIMKHAAQGGALQRTRGMEKERSLDLSFGAGLNP